MRLLVFFFSFFFWLSLSYSFRAPQTAMDAPKERKKRSLEEPPSHKKTRGNLPKELLRHSFSEAGPLIISTQDFPLSLGEVLSLKVPYDLIVSEKPVSVLAVVQSGRHKGAFLVGEARLSQPLQQVFIEFNKMRSADLQEIRGFKAHTVGFKSKIKVYQFGQKENTKALNYLLERLSERTKKQSGIFSQSLLEIKNLKEHIKDIKEKRTSFSYLKAPFFLKAVVIDNKERSKK